MPDADPDDLVCLDVVRGGCAGPVEFRQALSGSGVSFPRCEAHWQARCAWQEDHEAKYPDSDVAPPWVDPLAAGEHWNDDY